MKVISQETFDSVVLENVRDFDNTLEEAIQEAVKEFEAQGVQLSNIVKNPTLSEDNELITHCIVEKLKTLSGELKDLPQEDVILNLDTIQQQCKLSLAHRILGTKHDGYKVLLSVIQNYQENVEILTSALGAMTSLTNTNPDILDSDGLNTMKELLIKCQSGSYNECIIDSLGKWCLECCLKHENNRQHLVEADLPKFLASIMRSNQSSPKVAKSMCRALRAFTLDDDIRKEFGKAHDHARMLVEEHHLIHLCLDLIKGFLSDADVTSELLSTVSRLCVRSEYCQEAVDKGALVVINDILIAFPDHPGLNRQCLNLVKTISGNDKVKEEAMKIGAGHLIVSALTKHQSSAAVCEAGCAAVSMLSLRVPNHAKQLVQLGAGEAVVQAMKIHSSSSQIQKLGCMATRNLVARVPENKAALIDCGIEDVIHSALRSFPNVADLNDVAKAALRDLDLKVNLEEQWKGTGIELER